MKQIIFLLLASQMATISLAQNGKTSQLDVFTEGGISSGTTDQNFLNGIRYTHKLTPNLSWHVAACYGKVTKDYVLFNITASNDTGVMIGSDHSMTAFMPILATGADFQHRFYKHIYWFAGLDLRLGYDFGKKDSLRSANWVDSEANITQPPYYVMNRTTVEAKTQANMLYVGIAPYVGVKYEWKWLVAGIELPLVLIYTDVTSNHIHDRDFALGNISVQPFIGCRF